MEGIGLRFPGPVAELTIHSSGRTEKTKHGNKKREELVRFTVGKSIVDGAFERGSRVRDARCIAAVVGNIYLPNRR